MKNDILMIGELAKKMNISVRTLQYYDKEGLLKPSSQSEGGRRLYSSKDVVKLYQILSMKSLGFSLDEIKTMLVTLDTPKQVADVLENQGALVRKRITELQEAVNLIDTLHDEVLHIDSVDFNKYADIVGMLKAGNEFYWVLKLLDNKLQEHAKQRFEQEPQAGTNVLNTYTAILDEAVALVNANESPLSERSMNLAKKWWDMVQEFTGGDMSLLPNLMKFNDNKSGWQEDMAEKQKSIDAYIGEALMYYFSQSGITVPELESA